MINGGTNKSEALYEIIRCVRPLFMRLTEAVETELQGTGITVAMRAVMEQLYGHGEQTVPAIARSLNIKRQSVQQLIDELLVKNLVERAENPAHRKSWLNQLTVSGQKQIRAIREQERKNLKKIAQGLSKDDINTCLKVLRHMRDCFSDVDKWRS